MHIVVLAVDVWRRCTLSSTSPLSWMRKWRYSRRADEVSKLMWIFCAANVKKGFLKI
jgi:hypothetical protein